MLCVKRVLFPLLLAIWIQSTGVLSNSESFTSEPAALPVRSSSLVPSAADQGIEDLLDPKRLRFTVVGDDPAQLSPPVQQPSDSQRGAAGLVATISGRTRHWWRTQALLKQTLELIFLVEPHQTSTTLLIPFEDDVFFYSQSPQPVFPFPALEKRWRTRKADLLKVFFRSPTIEVEDVIRMHEFYVVLASMLMGGFWLLYSMYRTETYPDFHFDTLRLVPAALNGRLVRAFEMGIRVLIGDQTSPMRVFETQREHFMSLALPLCYCFCLCLVMFLAIYEERPTITLTLAIWILLGVTSRLLQASHLNDEAAEELLCSFTRAEILQQEQQVLEEPTHYAVTATTHLEKTAIDAFQRDCRIAHFVSQPRYIQVGLFVGIIVVLVSVSDNGQRIIADNFEEFYSDSTTFSVIYTAPILSFFAELFSNAVNVYVSLNLFKIPMLSILTTSSQTQAASFFVEHCPALAPYAYPTRSPPEDPAKSLHLWEHARLAFLQRVNRQLNFVQRPADTFYTCFVLLLATMLLFSSQTSFFFYNEYGLAITTAAFASSFVLLATIWESEKAYKTIHHDQETIFWDWWSAAALSTIEENLLTRPLPLVQEGSLGHLSAQFPFEANATYIAVVLLMWVWGAIFYYSIQCNERTLETLISS